MNVYRIHVIAKDCVSLIPDNLDWFSGRFDGNSLSKGWAVPAFRINGSSRSINDFLAWSSGAPVVSERVKEIFDSIADDFAEFLKMGNIKGKSYYAMNVLRVIDALDLDGTSFVEMSQGNLIRSAVIKDGQSLSFIFKTPQDKNCIFVTDKFISKYISMGLTGLKFIDPAIDYFRYSIRGGK
jgi:hypothetical protein